MKTTKEGEVSSKLRTYAPLEASLRIVAEFPLAPKSSLSRATSAHDFAPVLSATPSPRALRP